MPESRQARISVIVPSFNQGQFIGDTIESLISQKFDNLELIVVDAASTDTTPGVLAKFRNNIDTLISEPDEGQSDALIKGFAAATGDIWTWLNSDDLLLPGTLHEVACLFNASPNLEWVLGNVVWVDPTLKIIKCRKGGPHDRRLTERGLFSAMGPSSFFRSALYARAGGIDKDFHYLMDTDLWWKFLKSGATFARLKTYSWALRLHPEAKMSGHHFASSAFADREHPAHRRKAEERRIIGSRNPVLADASGGRARALDILDRARNPSYLKSIYDSVKHRGDDIRHSPLLRMRD